MLECDEDDDEISEGHSEVNKNKLLNMVVVSEDLPISQKHRWKIWVPVSSINLEPIGQSLA